MGTLIKKERQAKIQESGYFQRGRGEGGVGAGQPGAPEGPSMSP